ncbi:hypothetical protein [Brevundimonas vesicularis]|uniref:hypothetical protein n=1 Tax=Brevundimonas vesicularis TaxID=41276 RepID=UPI0030EC0DEC
MRQMRTLAHVQEADIQPARRTGNGASARTGQADLCLSLEDLNDLLGKSEFCDDPTGF